jgi:hypothetical protein
VRRLFRLLLIACVLVCGAHLAEPVQAHDEAAHHALEAGPGHAGDEPADAHESGAAHAVQHHCPVAPDQAFAARVCAADRGETTHFAAPAAALASLTRAPPLEPPAA